MEDVDLTLLRSLNNYHHYRSDVVSANLKTIEKLAGLRITGFMLHLLDDSIQPSDSQISLVTDICTTISEYYDDVTLRMWLFGTNQHLSGSSPAMVIRKSIVASDDPSLKEVVSAAKSLCGGEMLGS